VTHHPSPDKAKEDKTHDAIRDPEPPPKKVDNEALKKIAEDRGAKALKREKLKKDFEQLLGELKNLNRKKLQRPIPNRTQIQGEVYQTERDIQAKRITKQKRLHDAFETLINSVKSKQHQNTGPSQVPHSEIDLSSPPSLNLAICQQISMSRGTSPNHPMITRRIISSEEITVSQTSIPEGKDNKSPPRRSPQSSGRSPTQSSSRKSPSSTSKTATSSSKPPPYSDPPTESTERIRSTERFSPEVSVRSDAMAGEVRVTVKVHPETEPRKHKKRCKRAQQSSSSTSYEDPPDNLSPSEEKLLNDLMKQVSKKPMNQDLKKFIKKLLTMSRESIDELDVSTPSGLADPLRSPNQGGLSEDIAKLSDLTEHYVDKVNTLVDIFEEIQQIDNPENPFDSSYIAPPSPVTKVPPTRIPTPVRRQAPPPSREPSPVQVPLRRRQPSPAHGSYRPQPPSVLRTPLPRRQPSPVQGPSPTMTRRTPQYLPPSGVGRSRTPSPAQRIPHRPTTPSMQSRSRKPATPVPDVRPVRPPPDSASSRIPVSPRYQSPQRPPSQQPGIGLASIQTPFGLSANLLPHPREVFGQPQPDPELERGFTTQQATHLPPSSSSPQQRVSPPPSSPRKISAEGSDSSWDPFEGLPQPPTPTPGLRQRDVRSILRELRPDMSSIVTDSSFDISAELEKRGLADDFKRPRNREIPADQPDKRNTTPRPRHNKTDDIGELQKLDFESPSFNLDSIQRRLSEVFNEHYDKISEWLRTEPDLDKESLIREVLELDAAFDGGSQNVRSLALLQAFRTDP